MRPPRQGGQAEGAPYSTGFVTQTFSIVDTAATRRVPKKHGHSPIDYALREARHVQQLASFGPRLPASIVPGPDECAWVPAPGGLGGGARAPSLPQQGERSGKSPGFQQGRDSQMWCLSVHPLPLPRVHSRRGGEITPRAGREGGWEWGMGMRKGGFGGCEASVRERPRPGTAERPAKPSETPPDAPTIVATPRHTHPPSIHPSARPAIQPSVGRSPSTEHPSPTTSRRAPGRVSFGAFVKVAGRHRRPIRQPLLHIPYPTDVIAAGNGVIGLKARNGVSAHLTPPRAPDTTAAVSSAALSDRLSLHLRRRAGP
ncbi:hypothetical protein PCL_07514 [Purpureocillium lilacinum]|uniref:Uncharacterized protein n=1 Tax=Purpureocillium lilacinum TaxID=33203 RepID=A0A2U3EID3_PURLI|nr:hypothetical protein PCL_07514 [Purpureocillium lilacinum]